MSSPPSGARATILRGVAVIEMVLPDAGPGQAIASIVIAERRTRNQLREAKAAGAEHQVIDELTREWRALLSTLLMAYAVPGNWRQGSPCGVIPQDTADALSEQMLCLAADASVDTSALERSCREDIASVLKSACEEFRQGQSNVDRGRRGASRALKAVIRYVQGARLDLQDRLEPLYYLAASLDDFDAGRDAPMFVRGLKGGAPPTSSTEWLLKEIVAVAVSMLMDDKTRFYPGRGQRRSAANKHVQRKLALIGRTIDSIKVGNWKSEVWRHLPPGVGKPGKPDRTRPELSQCDERVRAYLLIWFEWQDKKADIPATTWVDGLISESSRFVAAAHPPINSQPK